MYDQLDPRQWFGEFVVFSLRCPATTGGWYRHCVNNDIDGSPIALMLLRGDNGRARIRRDALISRRATRTALSSYEDAR